VSINVGGAVATGTVPSGITAIANVVDYGVRNRDGSRAYNIPSNAGFSQ